MTAFNNEVCSTMIMMSNTDHDDGLFGITTFMTGITIFMTVS